MFTEKLRMIIELSTVMYRKLLNKIFFSLLEKHPRKPYKAVGHAGRTACKSSNDIAKYMNMYTCNSTFIRDELTSQFTRVTWFAETN